MLRSSAAAPPVVSTRSVLGAAWTLAVLSFLVTVLEAGDGNRYDIAVVWRAAGRLVAGEPLYVDGAFLYPPGAALLFAPLAARRCGLRTPRGAPLRRSGRSADCAVPEGDIGPSGTLVR